MRRRIKRHAFTAYHVVLQVKVQFRLRRAIGLRKINLDAKSRLAGFLHRQVARGGNSFHFLISIGLGGGHPDPNLLPGRQILYGEGVVKGEVTGVLGLGHDRKRKEQGRQDAEFAQHRRLPSMCSVRTEDLEFENWLETTHGRLRGNAVKGSRAFGCAWGKMRKRSPAMRYFSRPRSINHEGHEGTQRTSKAGFLRVLCGYLFSSNIQLCGCDLSVPGAEIIPAR